MAQPTKDEAAETIRIYRDTPGWTSTVERFLRMDNQELSFERVQYAKEHVFRRNAQLSMKIIDAILVIRQEGRHERATLVKPSNP